MRRHRFVHLSEESRRESPAVRACRTLSSAILIAIGFLAAPVAQARENGWREVGPATWSITGLAVDPTDPDAVYAATLGGGIFKSADGGATWAAANDGLDSPGLVGLAVDSSGRVYAATGLKIFSFSDGAPSWIVSSDSGILKSCPPNTIPFDPTTHRFGALAIGAGDPQVLCALSRR